MCFTRRRFAPILALIVSLLLASVTSAQNTGDWSALSAVAAGSKLVVKLKTEKSVEGKLSNVSDTALSLSVKNRPVELRREDVLSVHRVVGKSATKATLIGAGVGAGTGAVIGLAGSASHDSFNDLDKAVTAGLSVIGAGAGAITGYLIGRSGKKRILVYEAGRP